ncbi:hypothetical protein [Paraburkholderia fungorum]|nr:hypothetical protein [Paraburkholderia fungorum]
MPITKGVRADAIAGNSAFSIVFCGTAAAAQVASSFFTQATSPL